MVTLQPLAPEEEFVPLSALQHQLFCPRQCALIHAERIWQENVLTAEGRVLHEKVHNQGSEKRRDVKTVTSMPLASTRLRVAGVADVVELHRIGKKWQPFPIEYKRGKPKAHRADEVQLCAQAICLEEMFDTQVAQGAIFYGQNRRRHPVTFDEDLRHLTQRVADEVHSLLAESNSPPAIYEKRKCDACSLILVCRPKEFRRKQSVSDWISKQIAAGD